MFRCTLLEKLNEAKVKIQQCHEASAQLIQTELSKSSSKNDPQYRDAEFVYLTEMYKAGHTDYKAKYRNLLMKLKMSHQKINISLCMMPILSHFMVLIHQIMYQNH